MEEQLGTSGRTWTKLREEEGHFRERGWHSWSIKLILALVTTFIVGKLFITLQYRFVEPVRDNLGERLGAVDTVCDCGASTAEAQSNGCRFVEMAAAWLPPQCIDGQLSDEFAAAGDSDDGSWTYWSDSKRQNPINIQEVALLADSGGLFYSTWSWHVKHCMFQWRLDYRRRWLDTIVEPRYDHESHITHCQGIMYADRLGLTGATVRLNSSKMHDSHDMHHG